MELYITECGVSEQYVAGAQYRLSEYRGEVFTDAQGMWRRSVFLPKTKWVVYHLEEPAGDNNPLRLAKGQVGTLPHPSHLTVVPILPSDAEYALSYGATLGVEYIDGTAELVAVFPEDDLKADDLAAELGAPVDFYDKRHFYTYVERDADLQKLYNDSDLMPQSVLAIWMGNRWATYVR